MKRMTSRQRLLAASRHQPVDMIPLSPCIGHAAHYHCGSETPQNMLRLKNTYDYDPFITVDDIRKAVKLACQIGGKDGCFILGTSDSIREGTPIENIDAYFKYGRKYGKSI